MHKSPSTSLLAFRENDSPFTVGAEIELQVMDLGSLELVPHAAKFIHELRGLKLSKELFQSMLEVITGVCKNAEEVIHDLEFSLTEIDSFALKENLALSSTGNHPTADYNDRLVTDSPRYHQLIDRNQWLSRRTAVFGLHVHVAMRNGDECILFNNFMIRQLPMLIALSASSPYWKGIDSGLVTTRTTVYESIPTCGLPYMVESWEGFNVRYQELLRTNSIESMKDLWWDIRPSPGYGTLEIRVCDGIATLTELKAVTTFIQLLCLWFDQNRESFLNEYGAIPAHWILRENKWRAIRHGLNASLIHEKTVELVHIGDQIFNWINVLMPYAKETNCEGDLETIKHIILFGNSSERQRREFSRNNSMRDVLSLNTREYLNRKPEWKERIERDMSHRNL